MNERKKDRSGNEGACATATADDDVTTRYRTWIMHEAILIISKRLVGSGLVGSGRVGKEKKIIKRRIYNWTRDYVQSSVSGRPGSEYAIFLGFDWLTGHCLHHDIRSFSRKEEEESFHHLLLVATGYCSELVIMACPLLKLPAVSRPPARVSAVSLDVMTFQSTAIRYGRCTER